MTDYLPEHCFSMHEGAERLLPTIMQMLKNSIYSQDVLTVDTWQPANEKNLSLVLSIIATLVRDNSQIINSEHLLKIQSLLDQGKSCIIMPEHYSNFDLPGLFYLVNTKHPELQPVINKIISLSASKLNAESKIVLAFTEAFNRIMIYPARSKADNKENLTPEQIEEQKKLERINQQAIKTMLTARDKGNLILMFPSGTRFRPHDPQSRNALKQTSSFLKRFDYVCFIGIAGNTLIVNPNDNMAEDIVREDTMVYWIDEPIPSKDFMNQVEGGRTNKDGVAQHITSYLLSLHEKAESIRAPLVEQNPPRFLGPVATPKGIELFMKQHNITKEEFSQFFK